MQSKDVVTNLFVALSESLPQGYRKELSNTITVGLRTTCGFTPSVML